MSNTTGTGRNGIGRNGRRSSDSVIAEVLLLSYENKKAIDNLTKGLLDHMHEEEETIKALRARMEEIAAIAESSKLNIPENHTDHHRYIESIITRNDNNAAFWVEQRSRLATAGIWGILTITVSALWFLITEFLKSRGITF